MAYLIGWIGGFFLIGIYILIFKLYPEKTLIEILETVFGRYLGGLFSLLYIGYFIHLAGLVLRNFNEFTVISLYPETPMIFIAVCFLFPVVYGLLNGFEIVARLSEVLVPCLPVLVILLFLVLVPRFQVGSFRPVLERGFPPVLRASLSVLTFPFGESVVFLMVFPLLADKDKIFKVSYLAFAVAGFLLFIDSIKDLMVLGPKMLKKSIFPPMISARLIPNLNITLDALVGINLMIGGGIKITICLYAAAKGASQLFNSKEYKRFVLPLVTAVLVLSIWIYDDVFDMLHWAEKIYSFYAILFQIIIPILILVVAWLKIKTNK